MGNASLPVDVVALVRLAANGAPSISALSSSLTCAGVRTPPNDDVIMEDRAGVVMAVGPFGGQG